MAIIYGYLLASLLALNLAIPASPLVLEANEELIEEDDTWYETPVDKWAEARAELIRKAQSRRKLLGDPAIGAGWWNTSGNKIIDMNGNQVYFSGVNWDGFEYPDCVIDGVRPGMNRSFLGHLDQMKRVGFNLIRLPFAGTCIQPGVYPNKGSVDYTYNQPLVNLTNFEILQLVVKEAGARGIRVILDFHRIGPPFAPQYAAEFGLWYNETYPISFWLDTWKMVISHFVDDTNVVGVDLFNEPHNGPDHEGPFWAPYNTKYGFNWRTAARRAGNMILDINPNLLICVQGLWNNTWFGENLELVGVLPLELKVKNKLVYSAHDYGPLLMEQPWHHPPDYPNNLKAFWDQYFGWVHDQELAPVWIGEWGSYFNQTPNAFITEEQAKNNSFREWQWLTTFVEYIYEKDFCWTWFAWGPNGINIGGILADDWNGLRTDKLAVIQKLFYPGFQRSSPPPPPPYPPPSPPVYEGSSVPVVYITPSPPGQVLAPIFLNNPPPASALGSPPASGNGSRTATSVFVPFLVGLTMLWLNHLLVF